MAAVVRAVATVLIALAMLEPANAFVSLQQPCGLSVVSAAPAGTSVQSKTCLRSALRGDRRQRRGALSCGRGSAGSRSPTALVSWSDLEEVTPRILPSVFTEAELAETGAAGKTVLYRDANSWCPYAERVWLALELKNADYVTCLVDHCLADDAAEPGSVGSLPRVRWADGSTDDGSNVLSLLERIEKEFPQPPVLFPDTSASVDYVRDSFERFDGIMPRFTKPSRAAPYVLACKVQRAGSFEIENCELGEIVPKFKYEVSARSHSTVSCHSARIGHLHRPTNAQLHLLMRTNMNVHAHARIQVCLEEIDEMLEEYDDGPFLAGKGISAADVYWAPFLERLAAQVPVFYPNLAPRTAKGSRFEALNEWYDAMDEQVPCYASRVKGRAEVWQARLADEPWLEDKVTELSTVVVPDLPPQRGFNGDAVWARLVPLPTSRVHPHVTWPTGRVQASAHENLAHAIAATPKSGRM